MPNDPLKGRGIEALPSGRFKVRFRAINPADGKPKQYSRTLPDLQTALQFRKVAVDERGWARPDALKQWDAKPVYEPVAAVPTLSEFVDDKWLTWAKERMRRNTLRKEQSRINVYLKPAFGHMRLDAITRAVWFEYSIGMTGAKGQAISDKTRDSVYSLLRLILNLAVAYKKIPRSPLALSEGEKKDLLTTKASRSDNDGEPKATLTNEQFNAVLSYVPEQHRPLVQMFAIASLRPSEVAGLQWQDWNETTGILRPKRGVVNREVGPLKTAASKRDILVPAELAEQLRLQRTYSEVKLRRPLKPTDFIFATSRGTPFNDDNGRQDILYPALKKAGIQRVARQHGWYCLRRSGATALTQITGSPYAAQQQLGHTSVKTTERHYNQRKANEQTAVLAEHWKKSVTSRLPASVTPHSDAIN